MPAHREMLGAMSAWMSHPLLYVAVWCVLFRPSLTSGGWGQQVPEIWTQEMYPNPQVDVDRCGRQGKPSWVCDPNGIISQQEAGELDEVIETIQQTTGPCICGKKCPSIPGYQGYQPAVALLNKIYFKQRNPSKSQKKEAADDFSDYLRDDFWEFGRCNDDLVIFVSKEDRQVYTAVGDNTRELLTDSCVNQIYQKERPLLSKGRYATAIKEMLYEYRLVLQRNHECNKPADTTSILGGVLGVISAIFLGCVGLCLCRRFKPELFKSVCDGSSSGGHSGPHHSGHGHSVRRASASSASSGGGGGDF